MGSNGRILVVDDIRTNALILERALGKSGYEVLVADNGFDAVDIAVREQPDLVLIDVMMPDRDGLETCRILKATDATASIPVIFVTARSTMEDTLAAFEAGGSDYVTKPFKIAEVLARSSVHVRLRQAEKELVRKERETAAMAAELSNANLRLARLSQVDPLTSLLNRRAWEEAVRVEEARSRRTGSIYAILMIDVDWFKLFNDTQGHQAGDDCLRCIAPAISSACRTVDLVGRYGGEEFVVLAPESDLEDALVVAERIRATVQNLAIPHPKSPIGGRVTVSIGAASGVDCDWESVLRQADDALYRAKEEGRDRVCVAPGAAKVSAARRRDAVARAQRELKAAIPDDRLKTFEEIEAFLAQLRETVDGLATSFAEHNVDALAAAAYRLCVGTEAEVASHTASLAWKLRCSANLLQEIDELTSETTKIASTAELAPPHGDECCD